MSVTEPRRGRTCESFREAASELSRPFTIEAVRWKVQAMWPKEGTPEGGLVVCYMDAGLVIARLNLLVPHLWHDVYEDLGSGEMLCRLTIDGITREDVGEGTTRKARYSDSLKRAAVKFGVGVSLRRVPQSRIQAGAYARAWGSGNKRGLDLTQEGLDYLRQRYGMWLEAQGVAAFGEPLDHGDTGDAQGDEDASNGQFAEPMPEGEYLSEPEILQLYSVIEAVGWSPDETAMQLAAAGAQDTTDIRTAIRTLSRDQAVALIAKLTENAQPVEAGKPS